MYCIKCGNELNDGAAFCPKCGAPQQETAAPVAEQTAAVQSETAAPVAEQTAAVQSETAQAESMQSAAYTTYTAPAVQTAAQEPPYNTPCIVGLILSCVSAALSLIPFAGWLIYPPFSIAGIIVSAVGVSSSKKKGERGKVMGIIGIILGVLFLVLGLIVLIAGALAIYEYNYATY